MTTIRIDSEVLQELQKRAVDEGLVFGSPNQVLRRVLGLDAHRDQVEGVEPMSPIQMKTQGDASVAGDRLEGVEPMSPTYNSTRLPSRRVTGKRLLREHPELPQDLRAYADRDGGFYEWPRSFPAVLFDNIGYIHHGLQGRGILTEERPAIPHYVSRYSQGEHPRYHQFHT